jgi:hypothetical protein
MKSLVFSISVIVLLGSCCAQKSLTVNQKGPKLEEVVQAVQLQYKQAVDQLKTDGIDDFEISEADLSLKVTKATIKSADITVLIFKPSVKYTKTASTTVTYTLSQKNNSAGGAPPKVSDTNLKDLIISSVTTFHNLNATISDLTKESITLDLDFSVEKDLTGGLTFTVWGIAANASLESDNTVEHELKLIITPKKKP